MLFHGNCVTCHFEVKDVSAPSMMKVRENYLRAFPDKEDFIAYMSTWVKNPKEETSIMLGAIKKYELMPYLHYDLDSLKEIAAYVYETDFSKEHKGHKD
ncbi:cytochrome C [Sulfurimonas sp.]|uniref:cytochrome C n=1 Tax=Sulfurimonas sp. TaxID=2022749 RepID=UPI00356A8B1F